MKRALGARASRPLLIELQSRRFPPRVKNEERQSDEAEVCVCSRSSIGFFKAWVITLEGFANRLVVIENANTK
jgi:hypothetical protein